LLRRALLLDRDGVINREVGFTHRAEDIEFMDGIFDLVRLARQMGFLPVVVTNQSGIARGYFSEESFHALSYWMAERFASEGAPLEAIFYCPFHPDATDPAWRRDSAWRKPAPGMLLAAAELLALDLGRSLLIGDAERDVAAGAAAGVGHLVRLAPDVSERPPGNVTVVSTLAECRDLLSAIVRHPRGGA
jgi:D-glycero-D-manno-heptose 1,7-bisphosphate phosphatase